MEKILVIPEGKVRDYVDGTIRNDTPEEYVRQTVEKRLVNEHKYDRSRIAVEYPVQMGAGKKRADIVVFPASITAEQKKDQQNVILIVECKKESVEPTDKQNGTEQLKTYMSACNNCEWGMWTNGKHKTVYRKTVDESGHFVFVEYNDIPSADGSSDENERPNRNTLKQASDDNLLFAFRTCHNIIYINEGLQKQPAFFEFLKVIFCKIHDERTLTQPIRFYTTVKERNSRIGQASVYKRISALFDEVKQRNAQIFEKNDTIKLSPLTLTFIVAELQKYAMLRTNIDIKGKAYEEIVGSNLRGDRGEFFTPRNVMKMVVDMINPKDDERVLDSSCGTGGFVVTAMNKVIERLRQRMEEQYGEKNLWDSNTITLFNDLISETARNNFFGFDINPDLVKATKMNMVMNNDGSGNILQMNTLMPPQEWGDSVRTHLAQVLHLPADYTWSHRSIGLFDVIVTNPPFGAKIPIRDTQILEQFDLGHIWRKDTQGNWQMTDKLQSSVPPEQLFIERILQLLCEGGRAAIVLPDSILGSPGLEYIRQWLMHRTYIVASIDLHADTFQPHNGTQCSVLFVQKKTRDEMDQEEKSGVLFNSNIFMAMVEHVGHDKRGNTVYQRDAKGDLIMSEIEVQVTELDADGHATHRTETRQEKQIDDQTALVAPVFAEWKKQEGIAW